MSNNIYEFGGVADVLLRVKSDRTIAGNTYNENEPYTVLKDVTVQFIYDQIGKQADAKRSVYSSNFGRPSQLIINGVPLTQKIANLIMTNEDNTYIRTRKEIIQCKNGKLSTNYTPIENSMFIFDKNMQKVDNASSFVEGEEYLVFYQEECSGDKYSFEVPTYGYFSVEIFVKGNTNKITNDIYMHFDALSLATVPNFNIMNGGILNTPLVFNIIYTNQEEPIIVFE